MASRRFSRVKGGSAFFGALLSGGGVVSTAICSSAAISACLVSSRAMRASLSLVNLVSKTFCWDILIFKDEIPC